MSDVRTDVAIVGGGLSGLAVARELGARGRDALVLEASERPGGVTWTAEAEGRLLELGPQRIRPSGAVGELVEALGLSDELLLSPGELPLYVYRDGRLGEVPFSARGLLDTRILSVPGKLRLLAEPLTAGVRPGETVGHYLTRKLGREAYENLVGPLYGGLYGSNPADMLVEYSLGHVLRRFGVGRSLGLAVLRLARRRGEVPPPATFHQGMAALPDAMARSLGERVRLGAPVTALSREGRGWRVTIQGPGVPEWTVEAERVVLTVPAPRAAPLLAGVAPEAAGRVGALTYNRLVVTHLLCDRVRPGLGCQVSLAERELATRGLTFNAPAFGPRAEAPAGEKKARAARAGVVTAFLGGAGREDVAELGDDAAARLAEQEFQRITGEPGRTILVSRVAMPAWDRSWKQAAGLALPPGVSVCAAWSERPGIPGRLDQASRLARRLTTEGASDDS